MVSPLPVGLFVCMSAGKHKNYLMDFQQNLWKDEIWANMDPLKFGKDLDNGTDPGVWFYHLPSCALINEQVFKYYLLKTRKLNKGFDKKHGGHMQSCIFGNSSVAEQFHDFTWTIISAQSYTS